MEDTVNSMENWVIRIAKMLSEHKGEDTVVLDVRNQCFWTDYFIISTVTSQAHLRGLIRHLKETLSEIPLTPLNRSRKAREEDWFLMDCGDFVVHLMTKETRDFYNLERLWFSSAILYQSSKSS